MSKRSKVFLFAMSFLGAMYLSNAQAQAASDYATGYVTRVTTTTDGILIALNSGNTIPTECTGTPYGWLIVEQQDTTMTSLVMGLLLQGTLGSYPMTLYATKGIDSTGFCRVTQVEPALPIGSL